MRPGRWRARTYTPTATRTGYATPTRTRTQAGTPTPVPTRTPVTPTSTPTAVMADTQVWRFYYYAGSARIAVREKSAGMDNLYFLLSDHLGGASKTISATGSVVAELRYMAFGETWYENGNTPTELRYTGQRSFEEMGLYFYQSRFYDAMLGRFVQADTIGPNIFSPIEWDRYAYVGNNPIIFSDPTGHKACEIDNDEEKCLSDNPPTLPGPGSITSFPNSSHVDENGLSEGGRKVKQYFDYYNQTAGWWNDYKPNTLTVEQFLGIFILFESSGYRGEILDYIIEAVRYQLLGNTKSGNRGGNSPYCNGDNCDNGILNFIAAYHGYYKYPGDNLLYRRFGDLDTNRPAYARGERHIVSDLSGLAAKVTSDLFANKSTYQTADLETKPFGWGHIDTGDIVIFQILDHENRVVKTWNLTK